MKSNLLLIVLVLAMALFPAGLYAAGESTDMAGANLSQRTDVLSCRGIFWGRQATITLLRQFVSYNAYGDGYVWAGGEMQIGQYRLPMTYEGYSNLAPYPGFIQSGLETYYFKILDNTGVRMIIYDGRERLTAPAIWGEFVCSWQAYAPPANSSSSRNSSSQRGGESYYGEYGSVLRDENCTYVIVDGASIGGCE